ncbi:MAG: sugar phosphate isomerase/epimerase family protein [Terriglobia bacterium]
MKDPNINRREFVGKLAATAALLGPAAQAVARPQEAAKKPGMKVGLYSITYLGIWYQDRALTLEEVIQRAKKYGYDGVEFDGKRPHVNPLDCPPNRCRELRRIADGEGIEIFGVAANNDFSSPIPEHREAQVCYVRHLVNCASEMGAKLVRVFFAWPGITKHPQVADYDVAKRIWAYTHKPFTTDAAWAWCREGLTECARYASDAGVTLALQNHKPMMNDHNDVLRMIREVNSPALKMSFDPWGLPIKKPDYILKAAREVGSMQVLCHFGGVYERGADGKVKGEAHFRPFVAAMKDIGYQGYLSYEMCSEPPRVKGKIEGLERADRNAQLAAEFLRGLIQEA